MIPSNFFWIKISADKYFWLIFEWEMLLPFWRKLRWSEHVNLKNLCHEDGFELFVVQTLRILISNSINFTHKSQDCLRGWYGDGVCWPRQSFRQTLKAFSAAANVKVLYVPPTSHKVYHLNWQDQKVHKAISENTIIPFERDLGKSKMFWWQCKLWKMI